MAYNGLIEHVSIGEQEAKHADIIKLTKGIPRAQIKECQDCEIEPRNDENCFMRGNNGDGGQGWIIFDMQYLTLMSTLRCILLGSHDRSPPGHRS